MHHLCNGSIFLLLPVLELTQIIWSFEFGSTTDSENLLVLGPVLKLIQISFRFRVLFSMNFAHDSSS